MPSPTRYTPGGVHHAPRPPERPLDGFSPGQVAAIEAIEAWYARPGRQEFYLAGYAGTGKTTIASYLIRRLSARTCVATYTGKAASVLRRKGVEAARTIHSLIYEPVPGSNPVRFELSPRSALCEANLLVVDEVSMVGEDLAEDLRSFGVKTLVLGDPGQLPPIRGAGAFTSSSPDAFLSEIHRQAATSPILRLATAAREGRPLADDMFEEEACVAEPLTMTAVVDAWGRNSQLLCGTHRARRAITRRIREELGWSGPEVQTNERVICLKNDHAIGLCNGMLGTVEGIVEPEDDGIVVLRVRMDDLDQALELPVFTSGFREHYDDRRWEPRHVRGIARFDFGYAITVHKAQGSEWSDVTVVDDSSAFREEASRWLYTAITRASDRLTLLRRNP